MDAEPDIHRRSDRDCRWFVCLLLVDVFMKLKSPLIFLEHDQWNEIKKEYPAGTAVTAVTDFTGDESQICKRRCHELQKDTGQKHSTMMIGGRPRIVNHKFVEGMR
jgi:hypothetical protein